MRTGTHPSSGSGVQCERGRVAAHPGARMAGRSRRCAFSRARSVCGGRVGQAEQARCEPSRALAGQGGRRCAGERGIKDARVRRHCFLFLCLVFFSCCCVLSRREWGHWGHPHLGRVPTGGELWLWLKPEPACARPAPITRSRSARSARRPRPSARRPPSSARWSRSPPPAQRTQKRRPSRCR